MGHRTNALAGEASLGEGGSYRGLGAQGLLIGEPSRSSSASGPQPVSCGLIQLHSEKFQAIAREHGQVL